MRKHFILYPLSLILLMCLFMPLSFASDGSDLVPVRGVLHLNSDISSGEYTPDQLVTMAKEKGVKAVFLTENLRLKLEYGAQPFRKIVKKTVEMTSLLTYGVGRYQKRLEDIRKNNPGVSVFMSAEVAPFYYWTGSPFPLPGNLTLNDWDQQVIVLGMKPEAYAKVPSLDNNGFSRYSVRSLLMLWPLPVLVLGAVSLKRKHSRFYLTDTMCWALILIGTFFALRNFPFKEELFDQYHPNAGCEPHQTVIDFVNKNGGMVFWSTPEAVTKKTLGVRGIKFVSPPQMSRMLGTKDYTAFACFYEGYREVGGPGGVWDKVLKDYCQGRRSKPVWTVGEMSYHGSEGNSPKAINEVQTVFFVPSNTEDNILSAMRSGKMYAVRRGQEYQLQLDAFTVKYDGSSAMMGEELEARGPVTVSFNVSWEGKLQGDVTAQIIRSGEVIKEFKLQTPGTVELTDTVFEPGKKIYYRLDIRGGYPNMLFSNPIFIKFKTKN
jgi:hypothetical protein